MCDNVAREYDGRVVGAFETTVAGIRRVAGLDGTAVPRTDRAPDERAVVCYLDAEIAKAPPPGLDGAVAPSFDRAVIAVVDGQATLIVAGYRDRLPVVAP